MERILEIEKRLAEIGEEIKVPDAKLDVLEKEADELKEERQKLKDKIAQRKALEEKVKVEATVLRTFKEERKDEMDIEKRTREEILASDEYKTAYLKRLMGKKLNDVEKRSIDSIESGDVSGVLPTQTANAIVTKMRQVAPLLSEIKLMNVPGNLTMAVEGTNNDAAIHTENALITASADTVGKVELSGYEIVKLVSISKTVKAMAIPAFESWLVDILAENLAVVVENYIINGTGSSEPTGIDYFRTWTDGTNAVDFGAAEPTIDELDELVSYLGGGYFRGAKWLVSHGTFWKSIQTQRDDSTHKIVERMGDKYYLLGKEVLFSDYVRTGDIFLGDFSKIVGNFASAPNVESSNESGFRYNSIDYKADCLFDCDALIDAAFVKGAATITAGA